MILGKLAGALFGFMLMGPVGALFGAFIGHQLDRNLRHWQSGQANTHDQQAQQIFFNTTFSVLGHLAKADGRVSEKDIQAARQIMSRMRLNQTQKQHAIAEFTRGKQPGFNLLMELDRLQRACHGQRSLLQMFVEIQFQALLSIDTLSREQQKILEVICSRLRFSPQYFQHFETLFGRRTYSSYQHQRPTQPSVEPLKNAYDVLGVSSHAETAEIKRAYRRLISQHHPDKLVAKGLAPEMMKLATERTQQIQAAYDRIRQAREF